MHKFLKLFNEHFAYFSVAILIGVVTLFVLQPTRLDFATLLLAVTMIIVYVFLAHHYKEVQEHKKRQTFLSASNNQTEFEKSGYYATVDADFNITYFNKLFQKEYGLENRKILGHNLFELLHIEGNHIVPKLLKSGSFKGVVESINGENKRYQSLLIHPTVPHEMEEFFVICNDVTDSLKSDEELKAQFLIDRLTLLPTKAMLADDIYEAQSKTSLHANTLIYVKIDAFGEINEYFGIEAGNKILMYVADWLSAELPTQKSKLYKVDLNHFAIFTSQRLSVLALEEYLKKITQNIEKENFYFEGTALNISFTLGAARCKTDMLKCAYLALKDAKHLKKSYKIYDKSCQLDERFIKNLKTHQMIKDAIIEDRVVPFFQPIYNLHTNEVEKFETLIRIQSRNDYYLRPHEFLEVAKKSKLYLELSKSMIKSSFDKLEAMNFPITINITIDDILDKKVSSFILRRLHNSQKANLITFEIVESEEIEGDIKIFNFIKKIKELGCKVAIDDFGSGYSNFEQILKLDIDYLKIDGSLIKDIDKNSQSEILTKSIVSFAKELGIQTIAEYVSSESIMQKVKQLGIDYAQGYHIGRPTSSVGHL